MQNRRSERWGFSVAVPFPMSTRNLSGFAPVLNGQNTAIHFTLANTNPDMGFAIDKAPIAYC
jgi:hypothetical protein